MTSAPTGRLDGTDLILTRTFDLPIAELWAELTEPDRTARWFGTWTGDGAPGATIKVQMAYEEGKPWFDMRIDACEPERRLALTGLDESGGWQVELLLSPDSTLSFVHHLTTTEGIGSIGPGWEYYLDLLAGVPSPSFDDYFPAMQPYYEALR
ncbi:SRPBCC family protein [Catenuloplanes japonicus]|uniref:SRPBCC family protein n=1 Tax=Catenuloplanes japonicus TaxID=33876 RepID=UPI0005270C8C|nr:SRPBCC family protein [Catenuloplanes japonicus]